METETDTAGVPVTAPGLPDTLAVPFNPLEETVGVGSGVEDVDIKELPVRVTEMDWEKVGPRDLDAQPL